MTRGACPPRAGQRAVCDTGYKYYVTLLILQGSPRQVSSRPAHHAQLCCDNGQCSRAPEVRGVQECRCHSA